VAFERRGKVTLVFMWVGMRVVGGWWVVGWLVVVGDDVGDVVVFSRVLSSFNVVLGGW
jgi:hypothetical protein